jgi:hypothetical protein
MRTTPPARENAGERWQERGKYDKGSARRRQSNPVGDHGELMPDSVDQRCLQGDSREEDEGGDKSTFDSVGFTAIFEQSIQSLLHAVHAGVLLGKIRRTAMQPVRGAALAFMW